MMAWMRKKIAIDSDLGPQQRLAVAAEVIDHIVERTLKGKDKDGIKFPGYSKAYVKSEAGITAGKTLQSTVNLKRTFEMLNSMKILGHGPGYINIGFDRGDSRNNPIAEGHITGKYGKSKKIKKRDFLGLVPRELDKITEKYKDITDRREQLGDILATATSLLGETLKKKEE